MPRHLNEIKQHRKVEHLQIREKLIKIFEDPDLATAHLSALAPIQQSRDEPIADFMHLLRLLVLNSHPTLDYDSRERILVTNF